MNIPKRAVMVMIGGATLVAGGMLILAAGFWNRGLPEGLIQANGRIEGDHLTVASKFPGRIQELLVREVGLDAVVQQRQVGLALEPQLTEDRRAPFPHVSVASPTAHQLRHRARFRSQDVAQLPSGDGVDEVPPRP